MNDGVFQSYEEAFRWLCAHIDAHKLSDLGRKVLIGTCVHLTMRHAGQKERIIMLILMRGTATSQGSLV